MHRFWILFAFLLLAAHSPDELHSTPWSVDFVGQGGSMLDGQPLPAGAVVRAYDPTGVLAGRVEGAVAGWYLLSVYCDDPQTAELDEGAVAGDTIAFTVDGYPASPMGPDSPVWSTSGSRRHVELRACTLAGDFDCDCRVTVTDPSTGSGQALMRQARSFGVSLGEAGYYPPFDRDGDGGIDSRDLQAVAGRWRGLLRGCLQPLNEGGVLWRGQPLAQHVQHGSQIAGQQRRRL